MKDVHRRQRWLQLASVADDGTPRVRTLVFRGWKDDDQLLLFSDGRSSKILELTHQPEVELCWLFPKAKQQFRLRGVMTLTKRRTVLHFISSAGVRCATAVAPYGPGPSRVLLTIPRRRSSKNSEDSRPPNHFVVLALRVNRVELLDLNHHPHRRTWIAGDEWKQRCLNP